MVGTDIAHELAEGKIDMAVGAYPKLPDTLYQRRLFERHFVRLVRSGQEGSSAMEWSWLSLLPGEPPRIPSCS